MPPGLTDDRYRPRAATSILDPSLWERAGVKATRRTRCWSRVIDRPEPTVLLTQRTANLEIHAGQIAFPGGKIEAGDSSPVAAALREAEEEIGLDRSLVDPIGHLDLYLTFSGFRILPTVARVDPGFRLTLNPSEVQEAFSAAGLPDGRAKTTRCIAATGKA